MSYDNEDREVHNKVMEKLSKMSAEEIFQSSVDAGIYNEDGTLTKEYGGEYTTNKKEKIMRMMSDDEFHNLAMNNPDALLTLIQSGELKNGCLTFALESLGLVQIPIFEELLEATTHESAVVREGAVYGLSIYFSQIKYALKNLVDYDDSVGVREAAREVLEG